MRTIKIRIEKEASDMLTRWFSWKRLLIGAWIVEVFLLFDGGILFFLLVLSLAGLIRTKW